MSVSTASAASKTLNDLISQQQQQQVNIIILISIYLFFHRACVCVCVCLITKEINAEMMCM